jgi:hypothetical protein
MKVLVHAARYDIERFFETIILWEKASGIETGRRE